MGALWPFAPQAVFEDVTVVEASVAQVATNVSVAGLPGAVQRRQFKLRYEIITPADAVAMAAFYDARCGAWEAFDFLSPLDGRIYRVRFDSMMQRELFTPVYLRAGGDIVLEVLTP